MVCERKFPLSFLGPVRMMEFHEDVIRVIFEFSLEILRAVEEKNFYAGGWPT